jgi:hypothetical protein
MVIFIRQNARLDGQLKIVMMAASHVPVERRSQFLERCAAMLKVRGRFGDDDVMQITTLALTGLTQQPAA